MKRCSFFVTTGLLLIASLNAAWAADENVPGKAQSEIARRGPLVERVDGAQEASDAHAATATAMQPPANDSHKWLFTLVTTRNCVWCEQLRRDFDNDPRLKAWVDTKDYTKSWAHWQIVQIEDQSQAWRWKDFKPTAFPTLIVQPPVNGSWGDPHAIVYAHQGYLKPAELDGAIRKAIQLYAAKMFPRRLAWEGKQVAATPAATASGLQQRAADSPGGWTPPVTPPAPLPPMPAYPNYPSVPPETGPQQPRIASLLAQLFSSLFGGPGMANVLLLAILAWQVYRGIAKKEGIPLLVDDDATGQLTHLLQSLSQAATDNAAAGAKQANRPAASA